MNTLKRLVPYVAVLAALSAGASHAQPAPPPPHGGVPGAEALATIDGLSAAQQIEVRKILQQRRDAQEAAHDKARSDMEALRTKERHEHERIEDAATDQLRKLLGEEGYKRYAAWETAHRGPPMGPGRHGPHGDRPGGPGGPGGPDGDLPRPGGEAGPGHHGAQDQ